MRVGLIIYGSLDTLSGGYLYDRIIVEHLRNCGDEVEIITLAWRNYASHLTDNLSGSLLRRLSNSKFDVLVQDELNHPSLFWLNHQLRKHIKYPIVAIVHHLRSSELRPEWQNAIYKVIEKQYLQSVDGFIFNSRTTQGVVEGLIKGSRPAVVAYPGGDRLGVKCSNEQITVRAHQDRPLQIFFLGNLIPRKGLHVLIEALARLPIGKWHLTAVGSLIVDPTYAAQIQQQISRERLSEYITLPGPLSGESLIEHLSRSHVLAIPSSYEGFGIAYLEGMACGLPAIASKAGAAHEIITHQQDGFLIQTGDTQTLADHINMLIHDREQLAQMALAARERFDKHPTWQHSAESVRTFLLDIAGF